MLGYYITARGLCQYKNQTFFDLCNLARAYLRFSRYCLLFLYICSHAVSKNIFAHGRYFCDIGHVRRCFVRFGADAFRNAQLWRESRSRRKSQLRRESLAVSNAKTMSIIGKTAENSIPSERSFPLLPATQPTRAGPPELPTSPARARNANIAVPPVGQSSPAIE